MSGEILNLDDLLKNHIGNGEILKQDVTRLTAPGENYGSLMLKVDVIVRKGEKTEIVHAVAKCVPPNKKIQVIFNVSVTFINEIGWYQEGIPAILEFQREAGVKHPADCFMEVYGARTSLSNAELDENGVILCENLLTKGYVNVDRKVGFNLVQSNQIIRKLAQFHATTIGMKLKKPQMFEEKIKKFVHNRKNKKHFFDEQVFQGAFQVLERDPETTHYVPKIIENIHKFRDEMDKEKLFREPWVTAIHNDFWANNIMIKETKGKVPQVIILDLQMCAYESAVRDLLFFIGTSVQTAIAEEYFDDFLTLYHKEVLRNLEELHVQDTARFSYDLFEKELRLEAKETLIYILIFIAIVMAPKESVSDATSDDFDPEKDMIKVFKTVTDAHREKYLFITKQFAHKNWL